MLAKFFARDSLTWVNRSVAITPPLNPQASLSTRSDWRRPLISAVRTVGMAPVRCVFEDARVVHHRAGLRSTNPSSLP